MNNAAYAQQLGDYGYDKKEVEALINARTDQRDEARAMADDSDIYEFADEVDE